MEYLENNLAKDETILARVTHSKAAVIGSIIWGIIVVGVAVAIYYGIGALGDWILSLEGAPDFVEIIRDVLQIGVIVLGVLFAVWDIIDTVIKIKFNQLAVTNKRLLGREGMISKSVIDMPLTKLDNIQATNGIFGAIFHYGDLQILSAGSRGAGTIGGSLIYHYVKNTEEFRRAVVAAIDKAKEEERQAQAEAQAEALARVQERKQ